MAAARPLSGTITAHPAEDVLELYSMNRLVGDELERVEGHLLFCPNCRERLERADQWVAQMRAALTEIQARRNSSGAGLQTGLGPIRKPMHAELSPRLGERMWLLFEKLSDVLAGWPPHRALATGLALALIAVVVLPRALDKPSRLETPYPLSVHALRGSEPEIHRAPANAPLRVLLDPATSEAAATAILVDGRGNPVARVEVRPDTGNGVPAGSGYATFATGFQAGSYWLRLETAEGHALKEFRLVVR